MPKIDVVLNTSTLVTYHALQILTRYSAQALVCVVTYFNNWRHDVMFEYDAIWHEVCYAHNVSCCHDTCPAILSYVRCYACFVHLTCHTVPLVT